jgi:hypothetical protein
MRTIGLVAKDAPTRWPIVKDAKAETIWTVKEFIAKLLVETGRRAELIIETVH